MTSRFTIGQKLYAGGGPLALLVVALGAIVVVGQASAASGQAPSRRDQASPAVTISKTGRAEPAAAPAIGEPAPQTLSQGGF